MRNLCILVIFANPSLMGFSRTFQIIWTAIRSGSTRYCEVVANVVTPTTTATTARPYKPGRRRRVSRVKVTRRSRGDAARAQMDECHGLKPDPVVLTASGRSRHVSPGGR
ncbi:hypothetical protein EVAR_84107_1 [Eumeta japonica]|uniref:Uncharacterized protein n=1 Tax=Eumeta variegata TaxID=151549 RepID=A0A4C1UYU0_EUMVA|nr:hypothetical protein EVAR_84107_1 [Eumeta japonica]